MQCKKMSIANLKEKEENCKCQDQARKNHM